MVEAGAARVPPELALGLSRRLLRPGKPAVLARIARATARADDTMREERARTRRFAATAVL